MNITEIINRQRICFVKEHCTKEDALNRLIEVFENDHIIHDKVQFRNDIDKREKEFCTYVGHETAIPHAISKTVQKAGIAFLKSEKPIVYGEENEEVTMLFMLAIPEQSNEEHLRMLSLLATQLMHKDFRDKLMAANGIEDIYQVLCNIY